MLTLEFDKNQSIDIKKLRNSSANDEGRALAARWRAKMCHGGFNTAVSHLLISDEINHASFIKIDTNLPDTLTVTPVCLKE